MSEKELALLQIFKLQEELAHVSQLEHALDDRDKQKGHLAKTNEKLETKNSELKAENELALLQVAQLQEELEQVVEAQGLMKLESANGKLKNELDSLQTEHELILLKKKELLQEYSDVVRESVALKGKIKDFEAEKIEYEKQLNTERDSWQASRNTLEANYFDLKKEHEKLLLSHSQLIELNEQIENEVASYIDESESYKASLVAAEIKLSEAKDEHVKFKAQIQTNKESLELELKTLENSTSEQQEKLKLSQASIAELNSHNEILEQSVEKAYEECAVIKAQKNKLEAELSDVNKANVRLQSDIKDQLKKAEETTTNFTSQIVELKSSIKKTVAERERELARVSSLESELANIQKLNIEQSASFESQKHSLVLEKDHLVQELAECNKLKNQEQHWHIENKNWAESLKEEVKQLKNQLAEKSRSVNLGQKMLAKTQVDLEHLRDSYAEKVKSENELVELVRELQEKLTLASKYYFKLQQEHPELLGQADSSENV
ncbi:hypothetical protein [Thalassotalea euphylliae]|uniref:hypothetical protein n=1 Tax=Thalassotalea euphylliae TaxID=1655234 RepID=UPI0011C07B52|nr:hypothetical protein [Thalassotalea euphylliae]